MQSASYEKIQERAYQIWIREGCPHGRHAEHWRQAEFEIADEMRKSQSTAGPSDTGGPARAAESKPRPQSSVTHTQSAATPAVDEAAKDAPKKRASRSRAKPDPNAATLGKASEKQAGDRAIRQPPRK